MEPSSSFRPGASTLSTFNMKFSILMMLIVTASQACFGPAPSYAAIGLDRQGSFHDAMSTSLPPPSSSVQSCTLNAYYQLGFFPWVFVLSCLTDFHNHLSPCYCCQVLGHGEMLEYHQVPWDNFFSDLAWCKYIWTELNWEKFEWESTVAFRSRQRQRNTRYFSPAFALRLQ